MKILGREPVAAWAVLQTGFAMAYGLGWLPVTPVQFGLLMTFVAALFGFIVRQKVTPTAKL